MADQRDYSSLGWPPFARWSDGAYAIARVVIGFLYACHGAQKLFGVLGPAPPTGHPALQPIAGVIEFFGGILIIVGLRAGIAAFIACGEMAVAYFLVHAPKGFWPILNNGEKAVLFCFAFLVIAAHGSGQYSLDAWLSRMPGRARVPQAAEGSRG